tara:strand:+ start:668 stop:895 length:228 start_codon:yes stop_codon:yes gene_type:complete
MKKSKLVAGLVVGAAVGVGAGLLLAPKPGKETRRVVAARAAELRRKSRECMGTMRQKCVAHGAEESNGHVEALHA